VAVDVLAEILTNRALSRDYNVVGFAAPEIARRARPGQFLMVRTTDGSDPLLRRPFSIFEILRDAGGAPIGVSILNKSIGVGTSRLYSVKPGEKLSILGPLGKSWLDVFTDSPDSPDSHDSESWFVAGGVGLAPFVTFAEHLAAAERPIKLFYGGRSQSDLYYASMFETLGATLHLTTEDGTAGEKGRITLPLERELAAAQGKSITLYACGPTPMMRAVAMLGASHRARTVVSLEPVMGCGMGGCYSCVVKLADASHEHPHFVRSCLEGPVFDAARVHWDALVH
jgi:dihydroorotate dehydrogenase electron transfer subunit